MKEKTNIQFYFEWDSMTWGILPKEEYADLVHALCVYGKTGEVLEVSPTAQIAFGLMRSQIDRDAERYEKVCERNRQNVGKRWQEKQEKADTTAYENIPPYTTVYDRIKSYTKNTDKDKEEDKDKDKDKDKDRYIVEVKTVVQHLNEVTGSSYRASTEATKRHIIARLNDGLTADDLCKVIDTKAAQWLADAKMKKYLRPETLFGSKCEGYLQEGNKPKEKEQTVNDRNCIVL